MEMSSSDPSLKKLSANLHPLGFQGIYQQVRKEKMLLHLKVPHM